MIDACCCFRLSTLGARTYFSIRCQMNANQPKRLEVHTALLHCRTEEGRIVKFMQKIIILLAAVSQITAASARQTVSFAAGDGWLIHAHLYGEGARGLVLAHGGRFTRESWTDQAGLFANAGFRVLAIDLRGFGASTNGPAALRADFGSPLDVLAAVRYLRKSGATNISVIGGS